MASVGRGRAKRLAAVIRATDAALRWRLGWREQVAGCAAIRAALDEAGIDPADVSCLRMGRDAERRLAERGDTAERARAEAAYAAAFPSEHETLAARAGAREAHWADGNSPDPGASILDWFAWATVRGRVAGAEENFLSCASPHPNPPPRAGEGIASAGRNNPSLPGLDPGITGEGRVGAAVSDSAVSDSAGGGF